MAQFGSVISGFFLQLAAGGDRRWLGLRLLAALLGAACAAALAVAESPAQVAEMLAYVLEGRLPRCSN